MYRRFQNRRTVRAEFADYLLRQQKDKDFYIPSAQQIDEICRIGYEASSSEYKKLESFFIKKLRLPYEQAVTWCLQYGQIVMKENHH